MLSSQLRNALSLMPQGSGDDTPQLKNALGNHVEWSDEADISKFFAPFEHEIDETLRLMYRPQLRLRRSTDGKLIYMRIISMDLRKERTVVETIATPKTFENRATRLCKDYSDKIYLPF